jgi:(2R)-ethylmalonyl-CoA mutase
MTLVPRVTALLRDKGLADVPVLVGGIIPDDDRAALRQAGVSAIYTPGQASFTEIVRDIADRVAARA